MKRNKFDIRMKEESLFNKEEEAVALMHALRAEVDFELDEELEIGDDAL